MVWLNMSNLRLENEEGADISLILFLKQSIQTLNFKYVSI